MPSDFAVFVWTIDPDAEWAYSKFPSRLITIDYDANDRVIKMVAVGPEAERIEAALGAGTLTMWQPEERPA